jgi:cytochrome c-type biogenesis protein
VTGVAAVIAGPMIASVGDTFQRIAGSGSLVLAVPVALAAGLVSFLSPCVLPLVPGYLSYVTGLSGADLAAPRVRASVAPARVAVPAGSIGSAPAPGPASVAASSPAARRGRVLAGCVLFVLGFSVVFVATGAAFGGIGRALLAHERVLSRVLGGVTILLGLSFVATLPGLSREWRVHRLPAAGLAGAPVLGFLFGLGWAPCIGPTLAAVLALASSDNQASAGRGALLTFVYCLGLGVPFVVAGLGFRKAMGAFAVVKRHYAVVTGVGGVLLVAIGVLLVSGVWDDAVRWLQVHYSGYTPAV